MNSNSGKMEGMAGDGNPVPSSPHGNPYDINGTNFIPEKFIKKIISVGGINYGFLIVLF